MNALRFLVLSTIASIPLAFSACNGKSAADTVVGRYVGLEEGQEAIDLLLEPDGSFVEEYCGMHHWVWGVREGNWRRDNGLITFTTPFELFAPAMTVPVAADTDEPQGLLIRFSNWEGEALEGVRVSVNNRAQGVTTIDGIVEFAFDEYEGDYSRRDLETLAYDFDDVSISEAVNSPGARSFEVTIENPNTQHTVEEHEWWFVRGDRLVLAAAMGNQFESSVVSRTSRTSPLCSGAEFGRP